MLLKTKRLTIRHVAADDWKRIQEIWIDFNASEFAQYDRPHVTEDADVQARIAKWAAANGGTEHMFYAVCLDETVIGYIACNIREHGYEIGYCFHSAYHGQGYAKESHRALFDYLRTQGITKFFAGTAIRNTPSVKLLTALGFRQTGQERVSFYQDDRGNDIAFEGGIFELELLELYIPRLEDLWFYQKMMSDPETMSYNAGWDVEYDGYHRDTGCIDYPDEVLPDWHADWVGQEPERFYAYIKRSSDGAWIGDVNFHYTPEKDWWDMGIVLYAPYRGKGYAVPALRLMLDHAFCDCGISRLHNDFETTRDAAWAIHRKVGFREVSVENGLVQLILTKEDYWNQKG